MATRLRLKAVISRMFGLFLFVVAAGNGLVGQLDFAILFAVTGFVFVSLSGYLMSNPDQFSKSDKPVSDTVLRVVVSGGWGLVLISVVIVALLVLF